MKPAVLILLVAVFVAVGSLRGEENLTQAPYQILQGRKMAFADLTKTELGFRCTVYLKPGVTYPMGKMVEKMAPDLIVHQGDRLLMNGEFFEIGRHHLVVAWFGPGHAATWIPLSEGQVDYVVLPPLLKVGL